MRFWLELRRVRDICRSSSSAAPRAVVCESDVDEEMSVSGELTGRLMLTDPGESGASCASRLAALRKIITSVFASRFFGLRFFKLLHIYVVDRYVTRLGIHVTSPHGAIRTHRIGYGFRSGIHQTKGLAARPDLNPILRGLHQRVFFASD